jgi:phytoene dehydrogenase-like protein
MREVAVVGGGIGGLLAALHLHDHGARATVFEATGRLGGRARTSDADGFRLNQGPHALYRGGALHEALARFGVAVAGDGPDVAGGVALWGGVAHPFPSFDPQRPSPPLDAAATAALGGFYARLFAEPELGRGLTLAAALGHLPGPARTAVAALVRLSTYCHAPAALDAGAAFDQLRRAAAGVRYVDGGWQTLVDGLAEAARGAGVALATGTRVTGMEATADGPRLTLAGTDPRRFDAVVLAVPPSTAAALLPVSAALAGAAARARPVRLVALDLALSRLPRPDHLFALGMDEPVYLSVHSAAGDLAPAGGAVVHVARYLAPDERPAAAHAARLERLMDDLQPGWRGQVVRAQRLSGAVVAHDHPLAGEAERHPPVAVPDAPGVFLTGDWVGDDGLLADAVAASAAAAAQAAADHRALAPTP